jgi:peptidylprolyl isomerase
MPAPPRALLLALLVGALAGAGCGSSGSSAPTATANGTATPAAGGPRTVDAIAQSISHDLKARPSIPTPQGSPPSRFVKKDILRGTGRPVRPGETVQVQYVGITWSNGQVFDASWDHGQPFTFPVPGQVIRGWNEGVLGMRPGGRRLLIIPPAKAYGNLGTPDGAIAPNETLAVVMDLLRAR